jgi:translation initiation factor IF-2
MFTPEYEKVSYGKAKILGIFRTEKGQMIIGGKVEEGELKKTRPFYIWRNSEQIGKGEILELQQNKVPAKEISRGNEFGMKVKSSTKIQEGDVLESFEEHLKQKTL